MNTTDTPPIVLTVPPGSVLACEFEMLRASERNLRNYETRLRELQAELERTGAFTRTPRVLPATQAPFSREESTEERALMASWDKLYRARSLLEAEQGHLRDDRLVLQADRDELKRREAEVAQREMRVAELEQARAHAAAASAAASATGTRFSRTPFEVARAVFGSRK